MFEGTQGATGKVWRGPNDAECRIQSFHLQGRKFAELWAKECCNVAMRILPTCNGPHSAPPGRDKTWYFPYQLVKEFVHQQCHTSTGKDVARNVLSDHIGSQERWDSARKCFGPVVWVLSGTFPCQAIPFLEIPLSRLQMAMQLGPKIRLKKKKWPNMAWSRHPNFHSLSMPNYIIHLQNALASLVRSWLKASRRLMHLSDLEHFQLIISALFKAKTSRPVAILLLQWCALTTSETGWKGLHVSTLKCT